MGIVDRATGRVTGAFDRLRRNVFSLRGALVGLGLGLVAKSFIDAGREAERIRVQLSTLTSTAEEAARAFDTVTKFAGQVPFQLQEIARAAPILITVAKDVGELNQLLNITGDIAAGFNLPFEQAAQQIQRSFSAGIASADLFRERGVGAMLGFEQGVAISAEETRRHIIKLWEDGATVLVGAAQRMSRTWDGIMSMLQDAWFRFRLAVVEGGLFDFLKASLMELDEAVRTNFGSITRAGADMSMNIVNMIEVIAIGGAQVIDTIRPAGELALDIAGRLLDTFNNLPGWMQEIGIFGALLMGPRFAAAMLGGFALADEMARRSDAILDKLGVERESALRDIFGTGTNPTQQQIEINRPAPLFGGGVEAGTGRAADFAQTFESRTRSIINAIRERMQAMRDASSVEREVQQTAADSTEALKRETDAIKATSDALADAAKFREDLITADRRAAQQIAESVMTPAEILRGEQAEITRLHNLGFITEDTARRAKDLARETFQDATDEGQKAASEIQRLWMRAFDNVSDVGAEAFASIFRTGRLSFERLGDSLRDIMSRTLGEIVALFARQRIILPIAATVFGGGAASALGATNAASGLGSLFSPASSLFGLDLGGLGGFLGTNLIGGAVEAGTGAVAGGLSVGGLLGSAGLGALGGNLLAPLLGLNPTGASIGGGLGAAGGAALGSIIPGVGTVLGGLLGGAGGGFLGGLFGGGGGAPSHAFQAINIREGRPVAGQVVDFKGGDVNAAGQLGGQAIQSLNALLDAFELTIEGVDQFFAFAGSPGAFAHERSSGFLTGREFKGFTSVEMLFQTLINRGLLSGTAEQERVISRSAPDELAENLQFLQTINQLTTGTNNFERQINALTEEFGDMRQRAQELGISTSKIDAAFETARDNLINQALQPFSPFLQENTLKDRLDDLSEAFDVLRENSHKLGLTTNEVNNAFRRANDALLDQFVGGIQNLLDTINISAASTSSPLERVERAQAQFEQVLADAQGGQVQAIQELPRVAQALLQVARDVFASGPDFAAIFTEVNRSLNAIIENFGGFRQHGGPVDPMRSFVVGEAGPELFVPRTAGTIVANDQGFMGSREIVSAIDRGNREQIKIQTRMAMRLDDVEERLGSVEDLLQVSANKTRRQAAAG